MRNHDLHIYREEGEIVISSSDGVFSSIARRPNKEAFQAYCEEKAHEWLTSKLGNYSCWSKEDRKKLSNKWLDAKNLIEGKYNYYFNLGNIEDIFIEEVIQLAKILGITKYELIIERGSNR